MEAITLGLIAALSWGVHDVLVRYVSQQTSIYSALLVVLISGTFFQFLYLTLNGAPLLISAPALSLTLGSGLSFIVASLGLYKAFEIGPVRLVAPIVASYPIVTVAISLIGGVHISPMQVLAVAIIIAGVGTVASFFGQSTSKPEENVRQQELKSKAITWAVVSAIGFSASFAFGHAATSYSQELTVTFVTRIVAIFLLLLLMLVFKKRFLISVKELPFLLLMGLMDALAHASIISAGRLENSEYSAIAASTFGMVTILLAWIFLKEPMGKIQWFGVLMAFTGIAYLSAA